MIRITTFFLIISAVCGFCPNSQFQPLSRNVSPLRMAEEDSMVASKFEAEESSSQQAKNLVRDVDKVQQWKDEGKYSVFKHFY